MEIVSFCHLRWNFVYQRPQHLLSRFARHGTVHFWEEAVAGVVETPRLEITAAAGGIQVLTPHLPLHLTEAESIEAERFLLDEYLAENNIREFVAWYYTPMALRFSDHLSPSVVVYDCMDELSAFQGAPPALIHEEQRLFERAEVVFAGGASLYAAKRTQHRNTHLFRSSIDHAHFASARQHLPEPADQRSIPHPRIGFYGVLDERLDRDLLAQIAERRPDWHLVLIGPVVKLREEDLPRAHNLHYLGQKSYNELPAYLAHWDVAMLPFALNASTRFISPTKTPEYLAGGRPVVSTPIADVVHPYGEIELVHVAATAADFIEGIERARADTGERWLARVDAFLADNSWDKTFEGMWKEIQRWKSHTPARSAPERSSQGVDANV